MCTELESPSALGPKALGLAGLSLPPHAATRGHPLPARLPDLTAGRHPSQDRPGARGIGSPGGR